MLKASIRRDMLVRRQNMTEEACHALSLEIQSQVLSLPEMRSACTVALYSAFRKEVFTGEIFHRSLLAGKRCAYPRIGNGGMEFIEVRDLRDLRPGAYGIGEPSGSDALAIGELDLVVVPGVAFDVEGFRLGYGKGFYDRELKGIGGQATLIGLCFEFQLVPSLPAETHDIQMDLVVTERRILRCARGAAHK